MLCAYCRAENPETDDHVIPRGWFPENDPIKAPLVVRACHYCNAAKSKEDEWMRKWFATMVSDQSPEAMKVLYGQVARSIKRLPVLGHQMLERMSLVDVYHRPTGLWLGKQTKINISDEDWKRIIGWVDQVIRGLWAWDKNEPLPEEYGVQSFYACDEWIKPNERILKPILPNIPYPQAWHLKDANVFTFGRAYVAEDQKASVWITGFYNRMMFLSFVGTKEWMDNRRQQAEGRTKNMNDGTTRYLFKNAE